MPSIIQDRLQFMSRFRPLFGAKSVYTTKRERLTLTVEKILLIIKLIMT